MKRIGHLYEQIYSIENLYLADHKASRGKSHQYGVQQHLKNQDANLHSLHLALRDKTFRTSEYQTFLIHEPKEREIFRLPYFPDRILHHAVMNVLEPVFVSHFTADTYSCIRGRGIHSAAQKIRIALQDESETRYCLKIDLQKFYPSINHDILKALLRRKFKDTDLIDLLSEIIDSAPGLPIGNYLSQYLANYYLSFFDHWLKEDLRVKYYYRYADDLVFLSDSKPELHRILSEVGNYLKDKLHLKVKGNYQVFPVASRGIDFLGYCFYHTHTLLRKSIKKSFGRSISRGAGPATIASYKGWSKHCNSKHLLKKLLPKPTHT